jgi:hypothetical protein
MDYQKYILILGEQFYLNSIKNESIFNNLKSKYPLVYRKNKSYKDVYEAIEKVKRKRSKLVGISSEISIFNTYLLRILKG